MMPCCNAVSRGASVFCSKRAGAGRYIQEIWALHRDLCLLKIFKLRFNKACLLLIFDTCSDQSRSCILGWVGNCLVFFSLGIFFWISGSHHFPCYLQHFGAGNCHFHGMCNGFEFEPLIFHCIFHGICNSLQHVLSIFHALCSIFELESAFPPYVQHFTATFLTVLAGFWS